MLKKLLLIGLFLSIGNVMAFTLESSAFKDEASIPKIYSCDGENISPPLQWRDVPSNTKSLVLIVDDPDAPAGVWDHWILYNLPATTTQLSENLKNLPAGTLVGKNSHGEIKYNGPCPPDREHRYFFKLYALDTVLNLPKGATSKEVEEAMAGHIVGTAELMGRYKRQ